LDLTVALLPLDLLRFGKYSPFRLRVSASARRLVRAYRRAETGNPFPLRADPSKYVQDSVANWLNDAGKENPQRVQSLYAQWLADTSAPAILRICQRARRNLI
jgi:3-methyladenine DNA glycosylase AlkC